MPKNDAETAWSEDYNAGANRSPAMANPSPPGRLHDAWKDEWTDGGDPDPEEKDRWNADET